MEKDISIAMLKSFQSTQSNDLIDQFVQISSKTNENTNLYLNPYILRRIILAKKWDLAELSPLWIWALNQKEFAEIVAGTLISTGLRYSRSRKWACALIEHLFSTGNISHRIITNIISYFKKLNQFELALQVHEDYL